MPATRVKPTRSIRVSMLILVEWKGPLVVYE